MENLKFRFLLLGLALALLAYSLDIPISAQARIVMAITIFTGTLWFTEAMPLHVTALLSTLLLIVFASTNATAAFSPYFSPTIVLFFGGFMVAQAMAKHGVDSQIAIALSSKFGTDPKWFLLGVMSATAFISLWISNTSAAAIMLPIALYAITKSKLKPHQSNYAKSMVLGVAAAASIGGIGMVVGTPPNGIAVADLAKAGINVSFFDWAFYGFPFVVLFLPLAWFILTLVFPPEIKKLPIEQKAAEWTKDRKTIVAVMVLTIAVWVTSSIHNIADGAVAIGAVIALCALGFLETEDFSKIDWATLLLFGGGISLGAAIDSSGFGAYLGGLLGGMIAGQGMLFVLFAVGIFTVIMTLSASNTATAALIVPLVIPLAGAAGVGVKQLSVFASIGTYLDFIFPVGTPPSAIAYSTGYISVNDMIKSGVVITICGIILLSIMAWLYW